MLLVHATNPKYIQDILSDGSIRSFKNTGKVGEGEGESIMNPRAIFFTVLFDFYKILIPEVKSSVWLILDAEKTIKENPPDHFCAAWDWGHFEEKDCVKSKKSFKDTVKLWTSKYKQRWSLKKHPNRYFFGFPSSDFAMNEIVFSNPINLDGNLVGIYQYNAKWDHPLLMKKPEELMGFLTERGYNVTGTHNWPAGLRSENDFDFYEKYTKLARRTYKKKKSSRHSFARTRKNSFRT